MIDRTIEYYETHSAEFIAGTENVDMRELRQRFLKYLKPRQKILDAGCGSGRDIIAFREAGYEVDAFDASPVLCQSASEKTGIVVRQLRFEELEGEEQYDGIWACASLLHVKSENLSDVMNRLKSLLKKDGVLYVSFKYGTVERVKDGRYFNDLTEKGCCQLLNEAGLSLKEIFITQDARPDRTDEKWVNAIAVKSL